MLNSNTLSKELKEMFDDILPDALETSLNAMSDFKSKEIEEKNKDFAEMFTEMVSKPLADRIASSVDHYIKTACISGTILTTGSPVAQQAIIAPGMACGMALAGKVPNTLGIS